MKRTVLINQELKEEQLKKLKELLAAYKVCTKDFSMEDIQNAEVIIHWDQEMSELWKKGEFPHLKWVQVISAGINYIPLKEFREKGIILSNASGIHRNTISEHVMGMLLYHMRDMPTLLQNQQHKEWDQKVQIQELHGKTMLIVGAGHIGQKLASLARAFGMRTIGVNRSGRDVEEMDEMVTQDQIKQVLGEADIIVNILPETAETKGYFSKELFAAMKKGVQFVNVGRGSAVDSSALLDALDHGTVSFAALDVFEEEPLEESSPFWTHEKVFVSPHISGIMEHFRDALFSIIGPNAEAYAKTGKPSVNVIEEGKNY